MLILTAGMALWWGAHLFKRVAPSARASMGGAGRGVVAAVIILGVIMLVWGYRTAEIIPVYDPSSGMRHITNLLSLVAIYLAGVGPTKSVLSDRIRHPMLLGAIIWSVGHLLSNGHLAAIVLFAGIGLWAITSMLVINRADGEWQRPGTGHWKGDIKNVAGTVVIASVIGAIHVLLGVNPFAA